MDLRNLRYFTEIAGSGSVSRAALRLGRSQPALSKSVHDLERELELKLFERVGRGLVLTSNGMALLERARALLQDVDAIRDQARLLASGKAYTLRLGGAANIIERVLPQVLRRYRVRCPQVEVRIQPEGGTLLLNALESGELDVAITRHTRGAYLGAEPAFPIYALAAVPRGHRLSRRHSVSIQDLEHERLLVAPSSITSRRLLELAFQAHGLRPRIALEIHEVGSLLALAEAEQGIAVVPSTADTRGRRIRVMPIVDGGRPLGAWMAVVWNRLRGQAPGAADFVRLACEVLQADYPGRQLGLPLPARLGDLEEAESAPPRTGRRRAPQEPARRARGRPPGVRTAD